MSSTCTVELVSDRQTKKEQYIPGHAVRGKVRFTANEKEDLVALRLVVTGTEYMSSYKGNPESETYFSRTITLAGQQQKEEKHETQLFHAELAQYLVRNGRKDPLSGLVLATHAQTYEEYLEENPRMEEMRQLASQYNLTDGLLGEIMGDELRVNYPMTIPYSSRTSRKETISLSLEPGTTYSFPFAFTLPPWCPPSFHFNTAEMSGSMSYGIRVIVEKRKRGKAAKQSSIETETVGKKSFVVLSCIPRRELLQFHERSNMRPMFALKQRFRVFKSTSIGRFLHPAPQGIIDVKIRFSGSTGLLLRDTKDYVVKQIILGSNASQTTGGATSNSALDARIGTTVMGAVVNNDIREDTEEEVYYLPNVTSDTGDQGEGAQPSGADSTPGAAERRPRSGSDNSNIENNRSPSSPGNDTKYFPTKTLHLRVTVANGGFQENKKRRKNDDDDKGSNAIPKGETLRKIRVELLVQIRAREPGEIFDTVSSPICIAGQDFDGSVPPGSTCSFDAKLRLPPMFSHGVGNEPSVEDQNYTKDGKDVKSPLSASFRELFSKGSPTKGKGGKSSHSHVPQVSIPPTTGIHTKRISITTSLNVSFPGMYTAAEDPLPQNVVTLAEAVDLQDIVPFAPGTYIPVKAQ